MSRPRRRPGYLARKSVGRAVRTFVSVLPKQAPSLVTVCTVTDRVACRAAAMPSGMDVCPLRALLRAMTTIFPLPAGPPLATRLVTPSAPPARSA